jgi:asparagine synthase (glutamine-hydrolysing)
MCGINGFTFRDPQRIERMNTAINHRGPDDRGVYLEEGITFGHLRLSIIDLSAAGHQPMQTPDGNFTIIFNGEIYNFQELRKELEGRGYVFRSHSDTEVLLYAYACWGAACVEKLNGMFAFAIWDRAKQELFIARDQFGIKPLLYYYDGKALAFSSELKALLAYGAPAQLNTDALNMYMRFSYVPGPQTMVAGITKLQPGHWLKFHAGKLTIQRYWTPPAVNSTLDYRSSVVRVREEFDRAVQRQLVADVPLGLFLSGGVDSTAILGSMAKTTSQPIKTFTVRFDVDEEAKKFNEDSEIAARTAAQYKANHHEFVLTPAHIVEHLPKVAWYMDELVGNHTQTALYLLSQFARQHVTVVLGGDGSDELFAGYGRYYYYQLIEDLQRIPAPLRNNVLTRALAQRFGVSENLQKLNSRSAIELFWQFRAQKEKRVSHLLRPEHNRLALTQQQFAQQWFTQPWRNYADTLMRNDLMSWLVDESLTRSDKLTMAFGLEQRVPFLDRDLANLALTLPMKFKLDSATQGKRILREAVRDYLPDEVYNKSKSGWFSPMAKWLRGGVKEFAYDVLSPAYCPATEQYIDTAYARKLLDDHVNRRGYYLNEVWIALRFQLWYKQFIDSSHQ